MSPMFEGNIAYRVEGSGDEDSSIVRRWGTEIDLMFSTSTFIFDFLIEIVAAQFVLILAGHTPAKHHALICEARKNSALPHTCQRLRLSM